MPNCIWLESPKITFPAKVALLSEPFIFKAGALKVEPPTVVDGVISKWLSTFSWAAIIQLYLVTAGVKYNSGELLLIVTSSVKVAPPVTLTPVLVVSNFLLAL